MAILQLKAVSRTLDSEFALQSHFLRGSDLHHNTHSWLAASYSSILTVGSQVCVHRSWNNDNCWQDIDYLELSLIHSLSLLMRYIYHDTYHDMCVCVYIYH